jgi:cobyrinic acid a,c-diamide synthase
MMFLASNIVTDGISYPMASVLPLSIEMSPRLVKFGYVKVKLNRDCILGSAGMEAIGHSFHYSKIQSAADIATAYSLQYLGAGNIEQEGYSVGNVLASYIHIHFRTNRQLPEHLIRTARAACGIKQMA